MSPGECQPGEFRTEQDLKVIKCYLSGSSLVCTSARPARKHFEQEPGRLPPPEVSGEFQFETNMKIIKCHLSGRPLGCTSARPPRKHFDQEPRRMSIRRVPNRIAPGSYKVLPVREASGLHIGPAGSKALFPGARAVGARILGIQKELLFGTLFVSSDA